MEELHITKGDDKGAEVLLKEYVTVTQPTEIIIFELVSYVFFLSPSVIYNTLLIVLEPGSMWMNVFHSIQMANLLAFST